MANTQTRRTISFNRGLYNLVRNEASADGQSASHWVATVVVAELERRGRNVPGQTFFKPEKRTRGGALVAKSRGRVAP